MYVYKIHMEEKKHEKDIDYGSLGQIGTELIMELRQHYGAEHVIASSIEETCPEEIRESGVYEVADVLDAKRIAEICDKYKINQIVHLAAILSAVAEKEPQMAYNVNMNGLYNILEIAREKRLPFLPQVPLPIRPINSQRVCSARYDSASNYDVRSHKSCRRTLCDYYHKNSVWIPEELDFRG